MNHQTSKKTEVHFGNPLSRVFILTGGRLGVFKHLPGQ